MKITKTYKIEVGILFQKCVLDVIHRS